MLQGTTVGPAASEGAPRGQDHGLLQSTRETEEEQEPRSQAPAEDEGTQGWHASLWANTNAGPGAMQDPSTNFSLNMEYICMYFHSEEGNHSNPMFGNISCFSKSWYCFTF